MAERGARPCISRTRRRALEAAGVPLTPPLPDDAVTVLVGVPSPSLRSGPEQPSDGVRVDMPEER